MFVFVSSRHTDVFFAQRQGAGAVLGRVRPAGRLPAAAALVAAVCVQLSRAHRLVSPHFPVILANAEASFSTWH